MRGKNAGRNIDWFDQSHESNSSLELMCPSAHPMVSLLDCFALSTAVTLYFLTFQKHFDTALLQTSTLLYSSSSTTWNLPQKLFLMSRSPGSRRSSLPEDCWVRKMPSASEVATCSHTIRSTEKMVVKIQESSFYHLSLETWKDTGLSVQGRDMWIESEELKPKHHTCRKVHIWQDELGWCENKHPAPKRRNKNRLTDTQHFHLGCFGWVSDSLTWVFFTQVWVSEWKLV